MHIVTHASGFAVTDSNIQFLHRRLHFALDRLSDSIQRVVVRLSDINGHRGGIDKRCQLQVQLQGMPDVLIEDVQPDLYLAITRSVERAARTVTRRIARARAMALTAPTADIGVTLRKRGPSVRRAPGMTLEAS